jgi:hypothetical protein
MKTILKLSLFAVTTIIFIGAGLSVASADTTPAQQAQIDNLKKMYTMTTCPVSGDKLDSADMGGKPVDYLYTKKNADGTETTRLVRFCCKDCLLKFKKNPDKYLKVMDEAQTKKTFGTTSPDVEHEISQ